MKRLIIFLLLAIPSLAIGQSTRTLIPGAFRFIVLNGDQNATSASITETKVNAWDAATSAGGSHTQGTDTTLGTQTRAVSMGGYCIINMADPVNAQDGATKAFGAAAYLGTTATAANSALLDGHDSTNFLTSNTVGLSTWESVTVPNGNFTTDTSWVWGGTWTWSGGTATDDLSGGVLEPNPALTISAGTTYRASCDATIGGNASVEVSIGGASLGFLTTGANALSGIAVTTGNLLFTCVNTYSDSVVLDNVTLEKSAGIDAATLDGHDSTNYLTSATAHNALSPAGNGPEYYHINAAEAGDKANLSDNQTFMGGKTFSAVTTHTGTVNTGSSTITGTLAVSGATSLSALNVGTTGAGANVIKASGKIWAAKPGSNSTAAGGISLGNDDVFLRSNTTSGFAVDLWIAGAYREAMKLSATGDANFYNDVITSGTGRFTTVTATAYIDYTPFFDGTTTAALSAVAGIKADAKGQLDHGSLPAVARATIRQTAEREISSVTLPVVVGGEIVNVAETSRTIAATDTDTTRSQRIQMVTTEKPGRDIGAMVSIQAVAIKQLKIRSEEQQAEIAQLRQMLKDHIAGK